MRVLVCVLCLLLVAAEPAPTRIEAVAVDAVGVDVDRLVAETTLRAPHVAIEPFSATAAPEPERAYLRVRVSSPGQAELVLIVDDGRAWERNVAFSEAEPARAIAIEVTNLLEAIALDTIEPDHEGAKPPTSQPQPQPPSELKPEPRPMAPTEPAARREPSSKPKPERRAEPKPLPEVGLSLAPTFGLGVGPPRGGDALAAGAELVVDHRWPRGALAQVALRGMGWQNAGYRMGRVRVGLGGGYGVRRRSFELAVTGLATVEPWFVHSSEGRASLRQPDGTSARPGPLIGGALRVAPGFVRSLGGLTLRIALRTEIAGSGGTDGGLGVPRIADANTPGNFALRIGGLELFTGLDVGLWLPYRTGRRSKE